MGQGRSLGSVRITIPIIGVLEYPLSGEVADDHLWPMVRFQAVV